MRGVGVAQVRQAFTAEPGNTLVVADYGQLELRVLAHMAGCHSMKEAFKLGGDFHSRTALSMYDHIQAAISKGVALHFFSSMHRDVLLHLHVAGRLSL